ncbi:MAG: hypothetical protein ONB30_13290 [candidate division KSB1 bacterium]|nr:hypothetical protein [candidate division KSB1 bacterium]
MHRREAQWEGVLLAAVVVVLCGVVGYLVARHVALRRELGAREVPYIWKAEELAELARKENPGVKVVLTGEKGEWQKKGGPAVDLVFDLSLSEGYEGVSWVAGDGEGNLFLLEREACMIHRCTPEGKHLRTFGAKGGGPGELMMPLYMVLDREGNLCVLDAGNSKVAVFAPDGRFLKEVRLEFRGVPGGFAVDSTGTFYVSWYDARSECVIHKYSTSGDLLHSFGQPVRFRSPVAYPEITMKEQISAGPLLVAGDRLYYSQFNPYEIRQYTLDGELKMCVFRKNRFLRPARARRIGGDRYIVKPPPSSLFIGLWGDKIINQAGALPNPVIDIFDLQGQLLCSYSQPVNFMACHSLGGGVLYGGTLSEGAVAPSRVRLVLKERKKGIGQ